jgi:uncharacterized cupin superfamily protein
MLWAFLSHGNLSLTSENFKLVRQRIVKHFGCPTDHYSEGCWQCRPGEWRIRSAEGTDHIVGRGDSNFSKSGRERKEAASGGKSVLDCTQQRKVESISELYYTAPEKFSCCEVLDRASNSSDPSTRTRTGSQSTSRNCGCEGPPTDGDGIIVENVRVLLLSLCPVLIFPVRA